MLQALRARRKRARTNSGRSFAPGSGRWNSGAHCDCLRSSAVLRRTHAVIRGFVWPLRFDQRSVRIECARSLFALSAFCYSLSPSPSMSTSSPLVRGDREQPAEAAPAASDEDPWVDEPCGLKKYKRIAVFLVFAFFVVGFSLVIWVSVTKHEDNAAAAGSSLPPYGLAQMFNSSLAPERASLAWLASPPQLAGVTATPPPPDQFISVINGSFYLTTLSLSNTSFAPMLLIDAKDLNRPWPAATLARAASAAAASQRAPSSSSSSRRLMGDSSSSFDAEATASLHGAAPGRRGTRPSTSAAGRPTTPRTLRPKPGHLVRSQQPHSAHHQEQEQMHQSMHTMSAASPDVAPKSAAAADAPVFVYTSYALSPDQHAMLFGVDCIQLYRHSSFCTYLVYDIGAKTMTPLVSATAGGSSSPLRLATWSPTSGRVAYVQDDNIFVASLATLGVAAPVQVTSDGLWDHVGNGVADWVYEEEIFEATSALWWSPSGDSLAFLRFNQTSVPLFQFQFFTQPYNEDFSYKYPLPGFPNSVVDVHTFNVSSGAVTAYPQLRALWDYEYVLNVAWFDAANLMVRVENRAQNEWRMFKLGVGAGAADSSVTALSSARAPYYFEPHSCLTSLWPLPLYVDLVNSDSAGGVGTGDHLHLASFSIVDGSFDRFLTSGDFDVLSLDAVKISPSTSATGAGAAGSAVVYYTRELIQTAALIAVPTLWRTVSSTATNGSDAVQLFPSAEGAFTSQAGSYAPSGDFVLLQENAGAPRSTLYALNASAGAGAAVKEVVVLADNSALVSSLSSKFALPASAYFQIDSTLPGLKLSAQTMAPAGVDILDCSSVDRKRPVLIYAYSQAHTHLLLELSHFAPPSTRRSTCFVAPVFLTACLVCLCVRGVCWCDAVQVVLVLSK